MILYLPLFQLIHRVVLDRGDCIIGGLNSIKLSGTHGPGGNLNFGSAGRQSHSMKLLHYFPRSRETRTAIC